MIILIAGATHTGKTLLSQKLLEKYKYPYLSIDHLKMGLIRSGNTDLTVFDDERLTVYLWNIVKEIIKTAIENHQNLIIEGCYIPHDWRDSFSSEYLEEIRYCCLIMTKNYIESNFDKIIQYADTIEKRLDDSDFTKELLIRDNGNNLSLCRKYGNEYLLIDENYEVDLDLDE